MIQNAVPDGCKSKGTTIGRFWMSRSPWIVKHSKKLLFLSYFVTVVFTSIQSSSHDVFIFSLPDVAHLIDCI